MGGSEWGEADFGLPIWGGAGPAGGERRPKKGPKKNSRLRRDWYTLPITYVQDYLFPHSCARFLSPSLLSIYNSLSEYLTPVIRHAPREAVHLVSVHRSRTYLCLRNKISETENNACIFPGEKYDRPRKPEIAYLSTRKFADTDDRNVCYL